MPARKRPIKPKPNSDQPMKSSSPWKAREQLLEEESPGSMVGKLSSLESVFLFAYSLESGMKPVITSKNLFIKTTLRIEKRYAGWFTHTQGEVPATRVI